MINELHGVQVVTGWLVSRAALLIIKFFFLTLAS
jgi:hypothetical protein